MSFRLGTNPRVNMMRSALRRLSSPRSVFSTRRPAAHSVQWFRPTQTQTQEEPTPAIDQLKKIDRAIGRVGNTWNYDVELNALAQRLGYQLTQLPSLRTALTHHSVVTRGDGGCPPNDRLSVLGSAAMSHYIQEFLYHTYPNMYGLSMRDVAWFLTEYGMLTKISKHLGIADLLLHTVDPESTSPSITTIYGEAFISVLGALHVDQGAMAARNLIYDVLLPQLKGQDLGDIIKFKHPKFMLTTVLKILGMPSPVTRLLKESGRATHFPSFVVGVFSGKKHLADGCGSSLKRAEEEAISAALRSHYLKEMKNTNLPFDHDDYMPESAISLAEELNPQLKKVNEN